MSDSSNSLDIFKQNTLLVADTADINAIKEYKPVDATTNPSLILKNFDASKELILRVKAEDKNRTTPEISGVTPADTLYCRVAVAMGFEILKIISGRVSTEVPSRYSFAVKLTVELGRYIISLYEAKGISRERVLIKISSTWEGIEAAKVLEAEGIHCNMTLLFSLTQAVSCVQAGVTLVSPFVGRVSDWYKNNPTYQKEDYYHGTNDPGVALVKNIYHYYKHFGYKTEIMGASFRSLEQVLGLVGCDLLTIAPNFIEELKQYGGEVTVQLDAEEAKRLTVKPVTVDHEAFLWNLCEDPMATEKLAEGIRLFHQDFLKLVKLFEQK